MRAELELVRADLGVVGDVKDKPNSPSAEPAFWWAALQQRFPFTDMSLVVRANSSPELLGDAVRQVVRRIDPSLAVADVQLMDQIADASVASALQAACMVQRQLRRAA